MNDVRIKMYDTTDFLGGEPSRENSIHLITEEDAAVFTITSDKVLSQVVYLKFKQNPSYGWVYSNEKQKLFGSKMKSDSTSKFSIIPVNFHHKTFWISQNDKCLAYSKTNMHFALQECDENDRNQLFQFDNVGDINFDDDNAEVVLSLSNRNAFYLNKVRLSHRLEYEGNTLVSNIYGMLKKIVYCLNEMEICAFDRKYFEAQYAKYGVLESSSNSMSSRIASQLHVST